jgi:serine/threonine-protein kinase
LDSPELRRIAKLVGRGLLPPGPANACLQAWQAALRAGRPAAIGDVFAKAGLLTPTQAAVLARETLTERQPFRNYRLLRQAGEGGMAVVFEATYVPLKLRVALKILDTEFCLQEAYRLRFRREAGILLALEHENIVEGREYVTEDGVDFYAMDFVDGISLLDVLEKGVTLSERLALHVTMQVASALQHMHDKGIVHRDMKPANLVMDHTGHVRIIDFGLAKVMEGMRQDTADDTTVGTLEYMSPEQARGRSDVDARSDVYGLGCTLFHMVTGDLPFRGSPEEVMYGHVKRPVEFTPAQRTRVSPPVQYVIRKMMAKEPEERYASGDALVAEIRTLCAAILARPLDVPDMVRSQAIESAPIPAAPVAPRPGVARPGAGRPPAAGAPRPGQPPVPRRGEPPRPGLRRPGRRDA